MKLVVLSVMALLVPGVLPQETETKTFASPQAQRPLPATEPEKRALAQRLVATYELLDNAERQQLKQLTPYAFPLLLARYVQWAKAWQADPSGKHSYDLYVLGTDIPPLLQATCRKEDTAAVVRAWSSLEKGAWRDTLERILIAKGDPAGYISILVKQLRSLPVKERTESVALKMVSHSSCPEAVAFMIKALRDPKAPPDWRREAFLHLAEAGGPKGVRAVLAARAKPGPHKPWFDTLDIAHLPQEDRVDVKTDARGRTWMLFHSYVLGNLGDLFIVQKMGAKWGRPLFTGARTKMPYQDVEAKSVRNIPIAKLIATEWIKVFPDDPVIRQDTDGDGLTDLVEERLGTDPNKADTDGDGLSDLVDPCPNAAPRPLGDTEKIISACIEARFFAEDWDGPSILSEPNIKPFELYGCNGTILWNSSGNRLPVSELYGGGVNMISFYSPEDRGKSEFIQYDADHKTAHTIISCYQGGLSGDGSEVTLRKIGEEWFVIEIRTLYVS